MERLRPISISGIAAIVMLSLYLPQSFWTGLGQKVKTSAVTNIVSTAFLALKLERKEMHGTS
jgi:hypothetical protein